MRVKSGRPFADTLMIPVLKVMVAVLLSVVFFGFTLLRAKSVGIAADDVLITAILFSVLYLAAMALLLTQKDFDIITLLVLFAATAALIFARICLLPHISLDMSFFLLNWVKKMQNCAGFTALKAEIGDYNMPYMYILFVIAKLHAQSVILIKYVSCCFDVAAAFFIMKLTSPKTMSVRWRVLSFIAALAVPTVILNGAMWGQCDVVYGALCIVSMYFALKGKGTVSAVLYGFAFSFKLQAIFLLPSLLVCLFVKKLRLRDLLWGAGAFVVTLIPALLAGRDPVSTVSVYLKQTGLYPQMTMKASSVWQLLGGSYEFENFNTLAVMLCGAAVVTLLYLLWQERDFLGNSELVSVFCLFSLIIPFLLPQMHERYFFLADLLSLLLVFWKPKRWFVPVCVIFASYTGYSSYLTDYLPVSQKYTALLLLFVIGYLALDLYRDIAANKARAAANSAEKPVFTEV